MKKVSLLKKAFSMSGTVIRLLVGAGALALLVMGVSNRHRKRPEDSGSIKKSTQ